MSGLIPVIFVYSFPLAPTLYPACIFAPLKPIDFVKPPVLFV